MVAVVLRFCLWVLINSCEFMLCSTIIVGGAGINSFEVMPCGTGFEESLACVICVRQLVHFSYSLRAVRDWARF